MSARWRSIVRSGARSFPVVTAVLLCAVTRVQGQVVEMPARDLMRYEQVRLWAPGVTDDGVHGRVIEVDSLRLILRHDSERLSVPIAAVERADVLLRTERGKSALVGLVAGALVAGIGFKLYADHRYLNDEWNGVAAVLFAAPIGGAVGALTGFVVGRRVWHTVRLTSGDGADRGRPGLEFSVRVGVRLTR